VADFVNLKIKAAQSFGGTHRGRMYVHIYIWVSAHICMSIYVCTVFIKKEPRLIIGDYLNSGSKIASDSSVEPLLMTSSIVVFLPENLFY
jgi:hypothetical protein